MATLYYFAYGSNLHPLRLQERVPSAKVVGVVEAKGKKLTFSKKSEDQSSKCSFYASDNSEDSVFGVMYEMDVEDKAYLDKVENKGCGYNEYPITLELNGVSYTPFTYMADKQYVDVYLQPYDWYKQFVVEGAKYHSMPAKYIQWIESFPSIPDLNIDRNTENMARLDAMKKLNACIN